MKQLILAIFTLVPMLASCQPDEKPMKDPAAMPDIPAGAETATLAGGCYWCLEAAFRQLNGVSSVTSGFMGGAERNPSYEAVCQGTTGHAEVVHIVFDPKKLSYQKILEWFWKLHDPTTLNRQGADVGTQYRSAVFYHSEVQRTAAEASKTAAGKDFKDPIVTEITKASEFYPAPKYHQDFYSQNKSKNPYCRAVIEPKLKKTGLKH